MMNAAVMPDAITNGWSSTSETKRFTQRWVVCASLLNRDWMSPSLRRVK